MLANPKRNDRDQIRRIVSLTIMIFSGVGFKVFQFSGSLLVWMAILFLINFKSIIKMRSRVWIGMSMMTLLYILLFIIKNASTPYFVIVAMFNALFVLSNYIYDRELFYSDLSKLLKIFMFYSLVSIFVLMYGRGLFNQVQLGFSDYRTFFYIFWYVPIGGPEFLGGFRSIGITWEPGIWQLFLNLNIFFALYQNRSKVSIGLATLAAISVFSTTGIFITVFVYLMFILLIRAQQIKISNVFLAITIYLSFFPILLQNLEEKLFGIYMGSGATRLADFFTGLSVLSTHPAVGADVQIANATNNAALWSIKTFFWRGNFTDGAYAAYMTVANSNGIIRFLLDWGLPIGLFFLYRVLSSPLFSDKRFNYVFMSIFFISMFSEAISRTSIFYLFILASVFLSPEGRRRYG